MASSYKVGDVTVYYAGGSGSPLKSTTGGPVIYENIKTSCNKSRLFEDPDFPANSGSLGNVGGDSSARSGAAATNYKWCRPYQLCKSARIAKPQFSTAINTNNLGCSRLCSEHDLKQGGLGDCWYLAALGALTENPDQIKFVIPEDNFRGFDDGKYCGAFHFRFYSMAESKWFDVVVDDRIPSINNGTIPAFAQITNSKSLVAEFWPALIEKAYAKFAGTYHKIEGGYVSQALEDFTGGFAQMLNLKLLDNHNGITSSLSTYQQLKTKIALSLKSGAFMALDTYTGNAAYKNGCLDGYSDYVDTLTYDGVLKHKMSGYKFNTTTNQIEIDSSQTGLGLCPSHSYTVLDAHQVKSKDGKTKLFVLKIRNPHATHEWLGPFGDRDHYNWGLVEKDFRANVSGTTQIDDGVFWIELNHVIKYFSTLESCHFGLGDGTKLTTLKSAWPAELQTKAILISNTNLMNFTAYKFDVKRELQHAELPPTAENKCLMAFTLVLDEYHPAMEPRPQFSYFLYKVTKADLAKSLEPVYKDLTPVDWGQHGNTAREVSNWIFLEPGSYVIVPILRTAPKKEASPIPVEFAGRDIPFTLRIFTENETTIEPILPQKS